MLNQLPSFVWSPWVTATSLLPSPDEAIEYQFAIGALVWLQVCASVDSTIVKARANAIGLHLRIFIDSLFEAGRWRGDAVLAPVSFRGVHSGDGFHAGRVVV